jgi:cystathionine beta-lyase/cystathionine gamma-synthase
MPAQPDDICPRPEKLPPQPTQPQSAPIYLSSVYQCDNPADAAAMLAGDVPGHVYRRDGHPNSVLLAEKCRQLHGAEEAAITASGMAALALALVSQCRQGDHVLISNQMYGRSMSLLGAEAARLGIGSTVVDTCDLAATAAAFTPATKMLVVETIANPLLRVADIAGLAKLAHARDALLLVDNTFASPILCRPLELGADLVLESLSKIMNGHSDVILGLLCGGKSIWERVPSALSTWGWSAAPLDCWLTERGLGTLALRARQASANALAVAQFLAGRAELEAVYYPGLANHPDHDLAKRQFGELFGSVVAFTLRGGTAAAARFIAACRDIPFCPSLGEISTTLTHPESTSHRGLTPAAREALGIRGGTIRLSVGIEAAETIVNRLAAGLEAGG